VDIPTRGNLNGCNKNNHRRIPLVHIFGRKVVLAPSAARRGRTLEIRERLRTPPSILLATFPFAVLAGFVTPNVAATMRPFSPRISDPTNPFSLICNHGVGVCNENI
jgi:hypothetical protein